MANEVIELSNKSVTDNVEARLSRRRNVVKNVRMLD